MIKLLCFNFKVAFATTHPNAQDKVSTKTEIKAISKIDPITRATIKGAIIQYTMTAGTITTAEYINPIR